MMGKSYQDKKRKNKSGGHGLMQDTLDKMALEWGTKYREGKSNALGEEYSRKYK